MKFLLSIFSTAALLSLLHSPSYAADQPAGHDVESKAVAVGEAAPTWKDLEGVDGKKHNSTDIKDAKGLIVVFTCNHCPVAQAYEDRIVALANDYKDKGIELVAINVNNMEQDKLPAMKERAEAKGFKFDYLYDPSQAVGRAFGAMVTPHAFLLDRQKNLVYAGAIDDNMEVDKVEKQYLRDAIDAVLSGSKPETASTKPMGCGIQYE
jgi:thiol-disulfide isomerase/thioredoxin